VFYLFPVLLMSSLVGLWPGLVFAVLSPAAWTMADYMSGQSFSRPAYLIWNLLVRGLYYMLVAIMADRLHKAFSYQYSISQIDPLTNLLNSRGFYEKGYQAIFGKPKSSDSFTVAYLDLDNFKSVNDERGHAVGDELLCRVAEVMRKSAQEDDLLARFGGDEFVLLLRRVGLPDVQASFGRLREQLLDSMRHAGWPVTFSIGVLTFELPPNSLKEMVRLVDDLMYQVKRGGKDGILFRLYRASVVEPETPPRSSVAGLRRGDALACRSGNDQRGV